MNLNSSDTTGYNQILKQMMYGGKKVKKKIRKILRMEEREMKRREKRKYTCLGGGCHRRRLLKF